MGLGRSKFPISQEEAYARVPPDVIKRLQDTYDRFSSNTGLLPQVTFLRDIFGDGMPTKLTEELYDAFNGGQKGMKFNDLLKGLVLLIYGTKQEKALFLTQMLTNDDNIIMKETVQKFVSCTDSDPSIEDLDTLFFKEPWCSPDTFNKWILTHPDLSSFTQWLFDEDNVMSFTAEPDPPTFYQTLAEKYKLPERDVMDIEKTYWSLKGSNGKFDCSVLKKILSPPLPSKLCTHLFDFLDINRDGHIDLSEIVRGVALFCRRPIEERLQVCFQLFDQDKDGYLNKKEFTEMVQLLLTMKQDNLVEDSEALAAILQPLEEKLQAQGLSQEDLVTWNNSQQLVDVLLQVLVEVCHVKLGLRPLNVSSERDIIRGYMTRFYKSDRVTSGSIVHLISSQWFNTWRLYTDYEMKDCPLSTIISLSKHVINEKPKPRPPRPIDNTPTAEPITTVDVLDEGEEVTEGYTHIMTNGSNGSSSWSLSLCSANSSPPTSKVRPAADEGEEGDDPNKPGAIDNSVLCEPEPFAGSKKLISLTSEGGHLLPNLQEYKDYYILPEDVWRALVTWYGTAACTTGPSLPREVIDSQGTVELYPVMFKVYRHTTIPQSKQAKTGGPWNSVLEVLNFLGFRSGGETTTTPLNSSDMPDKPVIPRRILYYSAAFVQSSTIQEMCDTFQKVLHSKPEDLRIYDLTNEDQPELLDEETMTVKELGFKNGQNILVETRNKDNSWPEELVAVIKEVQTPNDSEKPKDKTKTQGTKVPEGATGLSNLGNTCFMNSALQCVSNLQPLTTYFREKDYLLEINKQNPLGMKGVMAKRYGDLVHDLWTGNSKSITPWRMRYTIANHAPQFNNFQQQDAQELLSFVLDGLHEDLNRVKVKPYRELPDSDDRPVAEVADEAWSYHRERNDSIIVDLFQGQLKSMVECTECSYTSMKFDPFTFLSLPLPLESSTNLEVIVVSLDGSQPIRYSLKLELDAKYNILREQLINISGVSRLFLVDVYGGTVRSFPNDSQKLRTILSGSLYAYEIPSAPPTHITREGSPVDIMREEEPPIEEGRGLEEVEPSKETESNQEGEQPKVEADEKRAESTKEEVETNEKGTELKLENVVSTESTNNNLENKESSDLSEEKEKEKTKGNEEGEETKGKTTSRSPTPHQLPSYCTPHIHGFLFAIHRRTLRLDNYFISTQKNRPILFSTPMIVPCLPGTPHCQLYKSIWNQVLRLIIPDPPDDDNERQSGVVNDKKYPFVLKTVKKDGLFCCKCPWYRFCRGCVIECDEGIFGDDPPHYIGIDWDDGFLHLKYQAALERPKDHESMEALKTLDTQPIELTDCLAAFSKSEELGEDELWYCKRCATHRPARKTLEIWKLPPVLIIHVKRFHFHNGRWIKSQRRVNFPINDLDPFAYSVTKDNLELNANDPDFNTTDLELNATDIDDFKGTDSESNEQTGRTSVTPPLLESRLSVEVHEDDKERSSPLQQPQVDERETHSEIENKEDSTRDKETDSQPDDKEEISSQNKERDCTLEGDASATKRVSSNKPHLNLNRTYSRTTSVYMSSRPIYDLFAITCHSGILGGGHYTSFAKNPNSNWYYYNDSTCKETTEERVASESAYMLFYQVRNLPDNATSYRVGGARHTPSSPVEEDEEGGVQQESGRGRGRGRCRQQ